MEGQKEEEKKHSNSRLSRKQGVKLAEELPNKCVCVHTGELGFVYYLVWISILCPQIKLQEKGEPGMRPQMSAALKSCERNPSERLKQQMCGTQTKACATLSVAFLVLESLFPESFIPLVVAEKGGDQGKASIRLTSSVLCIWVLAVTCITGESAGWDQVLCADRCIVRQKPLSDR